MNLGGGAGWRVDDYRRFDSERTRPARDLLARVPQGLRRRIVDLGYGPGNSTALLAERYPEAEIVGFDSSPDMLVAAKARLANVEFRRGDIAEWSDTNADLAFSNAAQHWVRDHVGVMRRIAERPPRGGCLAVQMPDNEDEPSHALMREIATMQRFRSKLADATTAREPIGAFADYDDALSPCCDSVDLWRTTYAHRLAGPAEERAEYLTLYRDEIIRAYPPRGGGVLLPFPWLFIVATRQQRD